MHTQIAIQPQTAIQAPQPQPAAPAYQGSAGATRRGGYHTVARGDRGGVETIIEHDASTGKGRFQVYRFDQVGNRILIASGTL
jgi:hypothetical protein